MPLHCTASGKILAAYSPEKISSNWPSAVLTAYTPNTITNPLELKKELENVREHGYAMDDGELDQNIKSYSAPIFDGNYAVPAALTVVIPKSRLSKELEEAILLNLRKCTAKISGELCQYE